MKVSAKIENSPANHKASVQTVGQMKELTIPGNPKGGSYVNRGELLMLALATCFCNDIYREAAKMDIKLNHVSVKASCEFVEEGSPGKNFTYAAKIKGNATPEELHALKQRTNEVAEIQNTLRVGVDVQLVD